MGSAQAAGNQISPLQGPKRRQGCEVESKGDHPLLSQGDHRGPKTSVMSLGRDKNHRQEPKQEEQGPMPGTKS